MHDLHLINNKYNLFSWTHVSRLRAQMESIEIFLYCSCLPFFLERSLRPSTRYARDGRIGRTRLAGPAGGRAMLSNLRSIFHSRNSFAIQFSNVLLCWTCHRRERPDRFWNFPLQTHPPRILLLLRSNQRVAENGHCTID